MPTVLLLLSCCSFVGVQDCSGTAPAAGRSEAQPLVWHTDYARAMSLARKQKKMLFVLFHATARNSISEQFESVSLRDAAIQKLLQRYVVVKVPVEASITVQGKKTVILEHQAFEEMRGQEGFAVIDFANPDTPQYGHVVTTVPFTRGKYYQFRPHHLAVILDLPAGSLTQRTLIFAVRIHPEAPASTKGEIDSVLLKEAEQHSSYQARIRNQGHHNWERRFPRLSRLMPMGLRAQEVVAESWPHEGLLDAAVDCVDSWRHSSGHWSAVRARQSRFAYDMKRGSNGIWYATGLFANRH